MRIGWILPLLVACGTDPGQPEPQRGDAGSGGDAAGGTAPGGGAGGAGPGAGGRGEGTGGSTDGGAPGAGGTGGGGPTRSFRLATTGAQLIVEGPELGLSMTAANVAEDADVWAVHQEFYGVPWDAFENDTEPPAEWVAVMDRLANGAKAANKPVFLSISMLNGRRETLAAKTRIETGQVKTDDAWAPRCYDFATAPDGASKKAAYLRYVAFMLQRFEPAYVTLAIEVNLFFENCPAAIAGVIDVANAAYDAVKAASSSSLAFPSFQIDHLYGYSKDTCPDPGSRAACFERGYAQIEPMRRDRFAMSTYPFMNGIGTAKDLPADWFTRAAARGGEVPLVAETGWLSTPLVARMRDGTCPAVFSFDEAASAAYLERVLSDAESAHIDLVTWWSDRDLVASELMTDCPCDFDTTWCTVLDIFRGPLQPGLADTQFFGEVLLKAFGAMGLRHYDGAPRAHLAPWKEARNKRYAAPAVP